MLKEPADLDILGVTFDAKMDFEKHLRSVSSAAAQRLGIIIIIIKKGQQCKAGREWYTPYQSEEPSPTIPTYRQKEEKGKESRRL